MNIGTVDLRTGLSAVALDGNTLWLACDEGCRVERLTKDEHLRGWACVLEVHPVDAGDRLELARIDGRVPSASTSSTWAGSASAICSCSATIS